MDLLFGTYRCPDHEPEAFGIHEKIRRDYPGQMMHPFRFRKQPAGRHSSSASSPSIIFSAIFMLMSCISFICWR
jgi:hypothetical protein